MKLWNDYFHGPYLAARPYVFSKIFLCMIALDAWRLMIGHAGRYGVAGFNVSHYAWLDRVLPLPTPAHYVATLLLAGMLALTLALLGARKLPMLALFALYTYSWSMSMLDSYQHHYFVSLVLLCMVFFPHDTLAPAPGAKTTGLGYPLLAATITIVYTFTSIAKMDAQWVDGFTMRRISTAHEVFDPLQRLAAQLGIAEASFWSLVSISVIPVELLIALGYALSPLQDRSDKRALHTSSRDDDPNHTRPAGGGEELTTNRISGRGEDPKHPRPTGGGQELTTKRTSGREDDPKHPRPAGGSEELTTKRISGPNHTRPAGGGNAQTTKRISGPNHTRPAGGGNAQTTTRWLRVGLALIFPCAILLHVGAERLRLDIGFFSYYMLALACVYLLPGAALERVARVITWPAQLVAKLLAENKDKPVKQWETWLTCAAVSGVLAASAYLLDLPGAGAAAVIAGLTLWGYALYTRLRDPNSPQARITHSALALGVASLLMWTAISLTEVRWDYYRYLAGDLQRRGEKQAALETYLKGERYAPKGSSRRNKIRQLQRELGIPVAR